MPPKSDAAFLWDMLDAAEAVVRFVSGRDLEDYKSNDIIRAAVERKVEVIGEAARGISEPLKQAHPEIPWRKIIAQRHVLAHE